MKNKFLLTIVCICCICAQSFAQTVRGQTSVSYIFTTILTTDDVTISVRVKNGTNNNGGHGVTIYWQVRNKINKPVFLEGTYTGFGSPLDGHNINKEGGTLPESKVEPYKTEIFETFAENMLSVTSISAELTHVYKKSAVSSGNGN